MSVNELYTKVSHLPVKHRRHTLGVCVSRCWIRSVKTDSELCSTFPCFTKRARVQLHSFHMNTTQLDLNQTSCYFSQTFSGESPVRVRSVTSSGGAAVR